MQSAMLPVLDAFGVTKGSRSVFATADLSTLEKLYKNYSPSAVNTSQTDADQEFNATAGEFNDNSVEEDLNLTMLARICERMDNVEVVAALDQPLESDAHNLLNLSNGGDASAAISSSPIASLNFFFETARRVAASDEQRDNRLQAMLQAGITNLISSRYRCFEHLGCQKEWLCRANPEAEESASTVVVR
jgi:hypothetical protein